jgi:hypothetical protein
MKLRVFATALIGVLVLSIAGLTSADHGPQSAKARQASRLISLLPASDAVAVFDTRRFFFNALPQILSANQPLLSEITAKIDEMQTKTGIDLRKFDQIAVGIAYIQISATETDYEPVVIAGGDINAGALLAVSKLESKGTYREEKIGTHTVYVFTAKAVVKKTAVNTTNSKVAGAVDRAMDGLSKEIAVADIDNNTVAIGTLDRVRETLEGRTHVAADLTGLLSQKETAVSSFSARSPGGMSKWLPLENDHLGTNLNAIQVVAGSLDVAAAGTTLQLMARTKTAEQAQGLKETLDGLQMVGKAFLSKAKRTDQQVYSRMLNNAKLGLHLNELTLELMVPQSDIDILVAQIK